ncbi:DUF6056 family protein [Streptomyces sp. NPDC059382]|uniref:DUF6056 family protein n=1 Tax=unclassified Streptomyces TaxID=2593676 RepID=UPI0033181B8D
MPLDSIRERLRPLVAYAAVVIALAASALLAVGAFLGLYVRPTSDDWCAAWKARDMGIFGITADFYNTQNGRLTNAFMSGIVYSDGILGTKVMPTLIILTMGAGLVMLARVGLRAFGWQVPIAVLIAASVVVTALFSFAGTRNYQALLWAPATISHTVPAIIGIWAVLIAVWAGRSGRVWPRRLALAAAVVIGFGIGTLSEPFTIVGGLFMGVAMLLSIPKVGLARTWWSFTWLATYCVSSLVGLAVLYTSPGAKWRRSVQPPSDSMLSGKALRKSFEDWGNIWDAIGGQWAYLGAVAAGLLIGLAVAYLSPTGAERVTAIPGRLKVLLIVLPVPVLMLASFVVAMALNNGYGPTGWTYARTWNSFMVPFLMTLCLYGILAGRAIGVRLASVDRGSLLPGALVVVLAAGFTVASVGALVPAVQEMTKDTVYRSLVWDKQDARIRKEVSRGATDVMYKPSYIGKLAEPYFTKNKDKDWVAQCVSKYYGVEDIHKP